MNTSKSKQLLRISDQLKVSHEGLGRKFHIVYSRLDASEKAASAFSTRLAQTEIELDELKLRIDQMEGNGVANGGCMRCRASSNVKNNGNVQNNTMERIALLLIFAALAILYRHIHPDISKI